MPTKAFKLVYYGQRMSYAKGEGRVRGTGRGRGEGGWEEGGGWRGGGGKEKKWEGGLKGGVLV